MEFGLVELAILRAGCADTDLHLVFHQVGQIIVDTVAGHRLLAAVFILHCPINSAVDEKEVDPVAFGVGDLGELETACRFFEIIVAKS